MSASNLGLTARDVVTGFTGVITGYVEYLTGCNQYLLVPKAENNTIPTGMWIDISRCEMMDTDPIRLPPPTKTKNRGGDISPSRRI